MCKIFITFISLLYIVVLTSPALAASSGPITSETALDTAISSGSTPLNIAGDIALGSSKTIDYAASLAGNAGRLYTLSGNNAVQLFRFSGDAGGISNLGFKQGHSSDYGGAAYVTGSLQNGISGSTFTGNSADFYGGAVYVTGSLQNGISGSTFTDNNAGNYGGAVYVGYDLVGGISQSIFTGNKTAGTYGGALYVNNNIVGDIANSTFSANTSDFNGGAIHVMSTLVGNVIDSTFTGNSTYHLGGALYVTRGISGSISGSTFTDNTSGSYGGAVYIGYNLEGGISGSIFTGNRATNGHGGAVYVEGDLQTGISQSTFTNNSIGDYGGHGGAIFVGGNLQSISQSTFTGNTIASSGSYGGAVNVDGNLQNGISQSTFTNNSSEIGGALNVTRDFAGGISQSTFADNSAGLIGGAVMVGGYFTGDIINSSFTGNNAGDNGGAMQVSENFTGDIRQSTFSNNHAKNGNASGGALYAGNNFAGGIIDSTFSQNSASGYGGALHINNNMTSNISGSTFTGNSAGFYGGALSVGKNLNLSGANARFIGNQALGVAGDGYSGLGGAIFYNSVAQYGGAPKTFNLSATSGAPIVFEGNTHNPGQSGAVPNSVYFGNDAIKHINNNGTVNATLNVDQGGALHLLDPIASQRDDFTNVVSGYSYTLSSLALTINKTGPGTLILAGHNDMQSATNWVVSEGALHMVADKSAQRAYINLANTSNAMGVADYASFTLKSGARLLVEPATTPHLISGQNITLESGSSAGLLGFRYGAHLPAGRYVMLTLDAPNVDNQSAVPQTSGTIAIGAYDYTYQNLGWQRQDHDLVVDLEERVLHPVRSGQPSITGSSHIAAKNPAFSAFSYHTKCLFDNWDRFPYQDENAVGLPQDICLGSNYLNHLWIVPSYVNINQSASGNNTGYLLQTAAVAMGYDRQLSENAFAGIGLSLSWPDYSGGDTEINASDITFGIYGGARLPYALELDGHAGFGFTRFDQERQVHNERYSEKYSGNSFFVGLGLGRPFALGSNFSLRPGVYYNFIHLNTDGFTEPHGTYAIKSDDYSQDIHRLKAGVSLSWKEPSTCLILRGEVYYLGMYGDHEAETVGYFVNHPENGFPMLGNGLDRDSLGLGLNVSLPVSEHWEFGAGYNVLFGADTVSQEGHLSAIFKF